MKGGLLPHTKTPTDLKLGAVYDQPIIAELPQEYLIPGVRITDQRDSDFCSQFAFCGLSELQEGVELSPEYAFALSKLLSGDVEAWGQDLKTAAATHVKFGAPKKSAVKFSVENKDATFLRKIENYGDSSTLLADAQNQKKEGYYGTSGRYFGGYNIMSWMWKFKDEQRGVATGVLWGWDDKEPIVSTIPTEGEGHAIRVVGWGKHYITNGKIDPTRPFKDNKTRLYVPNSWGEGAGDKGWFYFDIDVIDHFVDIYGGLMLKDLAPERARYLAENGLSADTSSLLNTILLLWKRVYSLLPELVRAVFTTSYNSETTSEVPAPIVPVPTKTNREILFDAAKSCVGKDMAKTQGALGCAESVNAVHALAFGREIGGTTSTYRLYQAMKVDPTFSRVDSPLPGDIILSPTGYGRLPNGHVGIVGEDIIFSNNSLNGMFEPNYTLFTWKLRFGKAGFPILFYRKV